MFIGEYTHNLDAKGRVAVPTKFRASLGMTAVLTRGLDGALFLYTEDAWKVLAEKLANLPVSSADSRAFTRLMLAGAVEVSMDAQGRIIVPEYLREYAKLGKTLVFTGVYNRIELWDEVVWNTYKLQTEQDSHEIAARMTELGI